MIVRCVAAVVALQREFNTHIPVATSALTGGAVMRAPFVVIDTRQPVPAMRRVIFSSSGCSVDSPIPQKATSGLSLSDASSPARRSTTARGMSLVLSGITSRGQNVHTALHAEVISRSSVVPDSVPKARYWKYRVVVTTSRPSARTYAVDDRTKSPSDSLWDPVTVHSGGRDQRS